GPEAGSMPRVMAAARREPDGQMAPTLLGLARQARRKRMRSAIQDWRATRPAAWPVARLAAPAMRRNRGNPRGRPERSPARTLGGMRGLPWRGRRAAAGRVAACRHQTQASGYYANRPA